ncbi:MAG: DNA photolyase family protein, partial [Bacteroidia bacterium]|nr:DNA photolyase family protein [Bacteroidia bacterium]
TVFTPYKRKWLERLFDNQQKDFNRFPSENSLSNLNPHAGSYLIPELDDMGFQASQKSIPRKEIDQDIIRSYGDKRDFPALKATSRLGLHLRFGTISIRTVARTAIEGSDVFLSELIWRDFYSQILQHFPHVEKNCFRPKYEYIDWRNNETEFKAWCEGKTGYPMVDAGMRELNATGFMHNRSRMITASFLTKHLLIDRRWGEAYFADKLLDFDLASNNGGWQWAAGCGTDAAPYFRIFNPESQQKKFDKNFEYIKKWVPEWGSEDYPKPIVEHKFARERCLEVYKKALNP